MYLPYLCSKTTCHGRQMRRRVRLEVCMCQWVADASAKFVESMWSWNSVQLRIVNCQAGEREPDEMQRWSRSRQQHFSAITCYQYLDNDVKWRRRNHRTNWAWVDPKIFSVMSPCHDRLFHLTHNFQKRKTVAGPGDDDNKQRRYTARERLPPTGKGLTLTIVAGSCSIVLPMDQ